jgi:hypothetical protein
MSENFEAYGKLLAEFDTERRAQMAAEAMTPESKHSELSQP